ncbi:MAG: GDP-mannose 4,6-dehydratase [Alphaproteobacteria bacterium]|nr:GDP-mannose 4,6-dehydratase [Alphaproteobacteria bacterium]
MKVLITGIHGFTGRHLEKELRDNGHDVVGLKSDLLDFDAINKEIELCKPEAVVHLAAQSFAHDQNIQKIYDVNVIGSCNLLGALYQSAPNVRSVLLASSATVYGNSTSNPISENSPLDPPNDYAVSKLSMEYMAKLWFQKLPIFMVRPFNYTGLGQKEHFLIPKIVAHFNKKIPIIELGNIDVWREFGDVRSVVNIYGKMLLNPPIHQTINICTGQIYSLKDVMSMCQEITNHTIKIVINPAFVRQNEIRELRGDPRTLGELFPNLPSCSLKETLRWMLKHHQQ